MKLAPASVQGHTSSARTMTLSPATMALAQIINVVMSSASEVELDRIFITAKAMVPLQQTLKEIKWPHPQLPIQTDNSTEKGVFQSNHCTQEKKSQCI